ncbi:UbiA family prenyltransferase [Dinghuibacter silviterrae]|uniref:1,4-dihydroxy-2-naphthoate octaprenyltransferase n=1 Tax=Dinghuibacter silviterrae TaxID=1539049 RepID=A0A4R8DR03_9BACT|nr:UbiA family prenyltransferase [Dinghuibacter silviterrae]TDX00228.1 1,4-dihydroxy-2-naphthoate octaprenyltransferase [Dinghuibacter silviterrae]
MFRSTVQLLRLPFSFFLLPVYLFALSQVKDPAPVRALLIFVIWHLLVYPASNGYNSYMDRDTGPIGGLKAPPMPTPWLFRVTLAMDVLAVILSFCVSPVFGCCCLAYIGASRAYSYRGLRLKRFPWLGYGTVVVFQGAVVFAATYHGCSRDLTLHIPVAPVVASSLLIGGFYPLTQVYQHEADARDGVRTVSAVLGYTGTFLFCGLVYLAGFAVLALYFARIHQVIRFLSIQAFFLPVLIYFVAWFSGVRKDHRKADHVHTMRMNWLAAAAANAAFGTLLIWSQFE